MNQEVVYKGLATLIKNRKFRYVDFYLNTKGIVFNLNKEILLCHYHLNKENYSELSQSLLQIESKKVPVMVMKELVDSMTTPYLKSEFDVIRDWADNTLAFGFRAQIYTKAEAFPQLIEILKAHDDFEWMKVYDLLLIKGGYKDEVKELYISISNNYLESHMGNKANEYVKKLDQRLKSINQEFMLLDIKETLFENFSHRTTFNIF